MRKGSAFPRWLFFITERLCLEAGASQIKLVWRGKKEPFRTSGGRAETLRRYSLNNLSRSGGRVTVQASPTANPSAFNRSASMMSPLASSFKVDVAPAN